MSNEELMKPRWKVIADYPGSDYHIGEILDRDWGWVGNDEIGFKHRVSHYPHLFKKLEWWEERYIKDMPLFIKNKTAIPTTYIKVDFWKISNRKDLGSYVQLLMVVDGKERDLNFWAIEPAIEEDYLSNLTQIEALNK